MGRSTQWTTRAAAAVPALLLLCALGARAQGPMAPVEPAEPREAETGPEDRMEHLRTPDAGEPEAPEPRGEPQAVSRLHRFHRVEMDLGRTAIDRARSVEVRRLGRLLLREHGLLDRMTLDFALRRGIEPVSVRLEPEEWGEIEDLTRASGAEFDGMFLRVTAKQHRREIESLRAARDASRDPVFRELLSRLIPVLEQHCELAETLSAGALRTEGR